jgi:hypothetical protein
VFKDHHLHVEDVEEDGVDVEDVEDAEDVIHVNTQI